MDASLQRLFAVFNFLARCRIDVGTLLGKGGRPYWVGGQGAIVLKLDAEGRVVQATFHPGKVIERPPLDFLAERLVLRWFYRE